MNKEEKKTITFILKYRGSGLSIGAVKKKYVARDPETMRKIFEDDEMPHKVLKFEKGMARFVEDEKYCNRLTGEMIRAEEFVTALLEQNPRVFADGTVRIVEDRYSRDIMKKLGMELKYRDELFEDIKIEKQPISHGIQTADIAGKTAALGRKAVEAAKEIKKAEVQEDKK